MKKNVIASVIFLCLFAVVLFKCSELLEDKQARYKYEPFFESETNFDVIFMGTSHVYNGIFPQELWKEYGISSYNWGYSNCTIAENYYILQDILKYTSPKLIVIDMYGLIEYENSQGYGNGKYRPDRIEQQHVQFDSIPLSLNKIKASQDIFDDYSGRVDFLFNFIMYHNRWTELTEKDVVIKTTPEKGANFVVGLGRNISFERIESNETMEIESTCYQYFLELLDYCSTNGIQLLCVYLPFPANEQAQLVANSIDDIVSSYPYCDYINLLNEDILNLTTDIYTDGSHLNFTGGCKVTSWLGEYILENYDVVSHSNEENYAELWNADYKDYLDFKIQTICGRTDIYEKMMLLYGTDFNAEISIAKGCEVESEDLILEEFIKGLANNIQRLDEDMLRENEKEYDILLIIKRADNQEVIDSAKYIYEDQKYIYIE
ncbi:MAG: hypothetical protein HDQ97_16185 [Lachnospiraceae bacterium]|nr:hypothetical protein [Lachnospiraceae bacterium]